MQIFSPFPTPEYYHLLAARRQLDNRGLAGLEPCEGREVFGQPPRTQNTLKVIQENPLSDKSVMFTTRYGDRLNISRFSFAAPVSFLAFLLFISYHDLHDR